MIFKNLQSNIITFGLEVVATVSFFAVGGLPKNSVDLAADLWQMVESIV